MIYLDRNESNYGPAPECFEVLKKADLTKLSWYTKAYKKGVKSILSERLSKELNVPEEQIVLGYGAEDLLKQTVQCYLEKGSKLLIPTYSWWYYKRIADEVDGVTIEYPLIKDKDSFHYDFAKMEKIYKREKPDIVFIASPNNPTGNALEIHEIEKIVSKFKKSIVVFDEAYAHLGNNDYVRGLIDNNPNLILIRTFSKYYALAGMRIGYGVIGKKLSEVSRFTNRYLGYHRLSEEVAIAALESKDYYKEVARKMQEDRDLFFDELNKLEGFQVFKSKANFVLVEIPMDIINPLKEFLLSKNLSVKFMNEALLNHHLRITLGTQEENRMLIEAIKEFMEK